MKSKKLFCKNCRHRLLKWANPKNKYGFHFLHYNRSYFGATAINNRWCSLCEVITVDRRTHDMKEVCDKPEVAINKGLVSIIAKLKMRPKKVK